MSSKKTILYIITSTNVGGTERALLELIKRIDRTRFDILVCSLKKEGALGLKPEKPLFAALNVACRKFIGVRSYGYEHSVVFFFDSS